MDMSAFTTGNDVSHSEAKLRKLCEAIRRNQHILATVFQFLAEDPPNASAAQEAFEEMTQDDQIAIWSVSPTSGGVWHTWQRDALKHGSLDITNSWNVYAARHNRSVRQ